MINEIKHLFPNADPQNDFSLEDKSDGNGPYIAQWDTVKLGPRPTTAQLAAVTTVANKQESDRIKNKMIEKQLAANELTIIRALVENDMVSIAAFRISQANLRAKLI